MSIDPKRTGWLSLCLIATSLVQSASGQGIPVLRLKPVEARLESEFTRIVGLRELQDERVLVADRGENRLVVADFRSGAVQPISRRGAGPNEFQLVSTLIPLSGDSTLMADAGSLGRWLLFAGSVVVGTLSAETNPFGARSAAPLGADNAGRVLAAILPRASNDAPKTIDSLFLVAVHRVTRRADTLTRIRSRHPSTARVFGEVVAFRQTPENAVLVRVARVSMDEALLFPDGSVAVVRRAPGRVEWWSGNRLRVIGQDKLELKKAVTSDPDSPMRLDDASPTTIGLPDGRLLVLQPTPDSTTVQAYEVIDRAGVPVAILRLDRQERLVGFGRRWAYSSFTDDNGLQFLRRHPWP